MKQNISIKPPYGDPDYGVYHKFFEEDHEIEIEFNIRVDGKPFNYIRHSTLLELIHMQTPENASKMKKQKDRVIQIINILELWGMLRNLRNKTIKGIR